MADALPGREWRTAGDRLFLSALKVSHEGSPWWEATVWELRAVEEKLEYWLRDLEGELTP